VAIFSRRVLQRMLDHNARTIVGAAITQHVQRLNRCDPGSIAAEWEVAVLYGLAQLGTVEHEPPGATASRLDVMFSNDRAAFVGEVVTVTDFGIDDENPLRDFQAAIARAARKYGLTLAGFAIIVGERHREATPNLKRFLALPPRADIQAFIKTHVEPFLRAIKRDPILPQESVTRTENVDVTIRYTPGRQGLEASYPSVSTPYSLENNPLFNDLKHKADQFKKAQASGTTVIFACDGGAGSIHRRLGGSATSYQPRDIIARFFQNHSVTCVCLLTIERPLVGIADQGPPRLHLDIFRNERLTSTDDAALAEILQQLPGLIPAPRDDVMNAINHLRGPDPCRGRSHFGGSEMTYDPEKPTVRMSSRALQEFLAGKVAVESFMAAHRWGSERGFLSNPFALALGQGRTIKAIQVDRSTTDDDDWVSITFSSPDPAIAPFRSP
jgi:hypothetical protein